MYQILIWWDTNWRNLHHLAWKEIHQVMEKKRWGKKKWVFNEIKSSWDIIWSRQRAREISSQSVSQADRQANRQDKETNHIRHGRFLTNIWIIYFLLRPGYLPWTLPRGHCNWETLCCFMTLVLPVMITCYQMWPAGTGCSQVWPGIMVISLTLPVNVPISHLVKNWVFWCDQFLTRCDQIVM